MCIRDSVIGHESLVFIGVDVQRPIGGLPLVLSKRRVGSEELIRIHHALTAQAGVAGVLAP